MNLSVDSMLVTLSAFASEDVRRERVEADFAVEERGFENPDPYNPEFIVRFSQAATMSYPRGRSSAIYLRADLDPSESVEDMDGFSRMLR
jgi:hypothetical protein